MQDILLIIKQYGKDLIYGLLLLVCIAITAYGVFFKKEEVSSDNNLVANFDNEAEEESNISEKATIYVDIKGAIAKPGVYEVKAESIINDVVNLAGGFLDDAYQDGINLSKKVTDEMVIYIYTNQEIKASSKTSNNSTENKTVFEQTTSNCVSSSYDINDCITKTESVIITSNKESANVTNGVANDPINSEDTTYESEEIVNNEPTTSGDDAENNTQLININTASKVELTELSGIGDARAEAIIEYRTTNGGFKEIQDILNVNGIGGAIFAKIKDYITV